MPYKNMEKRKKYQRESQTRYRLARKEVVVTMLGGCCAICGYKDNIRALELDHIKQIKRTAGSKDNPTGSRLWQLVYLGKEDISNIQLICSNCHSIKTYNDRFSGV